MSALSAAASDEDGDTINDLRAAIEQARDWIAEQPDRRPISAGRMVAILTNALAAAPQLSVVEHSQQPAMNHIAQRKLDSLLADGWAISGYSICKLLPSSEMRHGFVTSGGLVGWWPQPLPTQGEQKSVGWLPIDGRGGYDHPQNLNCKSTQARLATLWGYERPQPKRKPLTDERIREIGQTYTDESWIDEGWSYSFARAIEAAHGIGGEA